MDILPTIGEAVTQLKNIDKWTKPEKPPFSFNFAAMKPMIRKEAKGTVLIISPFNYPVWLTLSPVVSLMALFVNRGSFFSMSRSLGGCNCCWKHCLPQAFGINTSDELIDSRTFAQVFGRGRCEADQWCYSRDD